MFDDPRALYFFFDYISHNAYLAWQRMPALARQHGLTIEPVPVLFAGLLKTYRQVGPAELPVKSRWMLWNVLRKARRLNIPIAPPHTHPFNPLLALRLACTDLAHDARVELVTRCFAATWAQSRAVSEPAVLKEIARECGLDGEALLAQAEGEAAKARLREWYDGALAAGVFGVPTMIVRGELFWGFDDLPQLEDFLAGRDPLGSDRSLYAAWQQVRPSAQRKP